MEAFATISLQGRTVTLGLSPLEVCRLVAFAAGFGDVDVDTGPNGVEIVCTGDKRKLRAKGSDTAKAVESLIEKLHG